MDRLGKTSDQVVARNEFEIKRTAQIIEKFGSLERWNVI